MEQLILAEISTIHMTVLITAFQIIQQLEITFVLLNIFEVFRTSSEI